MQVRRNFIWGVLVVICLGHVCAFGNCPPLSLDPNDYVEDPNILENGLFECGDPYNYTPYGTIYNFTPPLYWTRTVNFNTWDQISDPNNNNNNCYAGLHSHFSPDREKWEIPFPYEGNTFVLLSTGDPSDPNLDSGQVESSTICQEVFLNKGDTITGAYFFGTLEPSENFPNFFRMLIGIVTCPLVVTLIF